MEAASISIDEFVVSLMSPTVQLFHTTYRVPDPKSQQEGCHPSWFSLDCRWPEKICWVSWEFCKSSQDRSIFFCQFRNKTITQDDEFTRSSPPLQFR